MKLFPSLNSVATVCLLAFAPVQAATIVSSQVWISGADWESNYGAVASQDYDGSEIGFYDGWKGGSITISLADGETLIDAFVTGTTTFEPRVGWPDLAPITHSIPLYSGVSGPVSGPVTITLDVWKTGPAGETNPRTFVQFYAFGWAPPQMRIFETSVSFTINTNLGTFHDDNGGEGYTAIQPVPEPGSLLLGTIACAGFLARRRK